MEIQEWIKNIKIIEGEKIGGSYTNYWDKKDLTLEINGKLAYYNNPSTGRKEETTLEGELNKVSLLIIEETNITDLDLSGCSNLEQITVEDNPLLASIDFLTHLPNPEKLNYLEIRNNNFAAATLDFLEPFVNLKSLRLGMNHHEKISDLIEKGTYNKFHGSLKPLKDLKKLSILDISDTDIDSGWEYLNEEIEWRNFSCDAWLRPDAKSGKLQVEKNKYEPFSKIGLNQERKVQNQTGKAAKTLRWLGLLGVVLIGLLIVYSFLCKKKVKTQPLAT